MTFHPDSVSIEPIREEDASGGRRITLRALLSTARVKIQVDIGIGDAVTPGHSGSTPESTRPASTATPGVPPRDSRRGETPCDRAARHAE